MKRKYLYLLFLYLLSLLLGIGLILAIPFFKHSSQLSNMARRASETYLNDKDFGITARFGISYLVYNLEGECTDQDVSGFQNARYELNIQRLLKDIENGNTTVRYENVSIRSDEFKRSARHVLSIVAASPIWKDQTIIGCMVLIRGLEDQVGFLFGFVFLWTVILVLIAMYFYFVDKKEAELENLRRTYIADMNHELKSPITSIKALAETLLYGYVTEPERQMFYYSTILKEANTLEDTVLKILELSKLKSKPSLYKKEYIPAEKIFHEVFERYRTYCEEVELELELPDLHVLPTLYTSPGLLPRVMELLLHNSIKFVPEDGGQIRVTAETQKDRLVFCVTDNGCGIPQDALPHIFESFYQAEYAHNQSGSGMGLAIVKEILDGLHETITVKSSPENGTAFSFTVSTTEQKHR